MGNQVSCGGIPFADRAMCSAGFGDERGWSDRRPPRRSPDRRAGPDLLAACGRVSSPARVELEELMSADVVGIDALRRIEEDGAQLVGLLQYLQFELDTLKHQTL